MALRVSLYEILFFIILTILTNLHARRNFILILKDIQCTPNEEYVTNVSCEVDQSPPFSRINMDGQMHKLVKELRINIFVSLVRSKKESISLFKVKGLQACKVFRQEINLPILKMYRDMLSKAGTWPTECPFPADFYFRFRNFTLDPEYLPAYIPESDFKVLVDLTDKGTSFWASTTLGRIAYKKHVKKH